MDNWSPGTSLACVGCGSEHDPGAVTHRCPDCEGSLTVERAVDRDEYESVATSRFDGLGRFAPVLPLERPALRTLDEGTTPLVECPGLAERFEVDAVHYKDEGCNPTGAMADRGIAVAVSAASAHDADRVVLPSTGPAGRAAAAYAARAGLDAEAFVPSRSTFDAKAMTNVHGGEMTVVEGRYDDAVAAFDAGDDHSLAPFDTPYRQEGAKTLVYEWYEQLGGELPDAVVHPASHGVGLVGIRRGIAEMRSVDPDATRPSLYAAQPAGCAPLVEAFRAGERTPRTVEAPDTVCGPLEVPRLDDGGGRLALEALDDTDGGAVAVEDADALERAVSLGRTDGVGASATGGVAVAAAAQLADRGKLDADDAVVIVDPIAADAEADLLRSHLMSRGE